MEKLRCPLSAVPGVRPTNFYAKKSHEGKKNQSTRIVEKRDSSAAVLSRPAESVSNNFSTSLKRKRLTTMPLEFSSECELSDSEVSTGSEYQISSEESEESDFEALVCEKSVMTSGKKRKQMDDESQTPLSIKVKKVSVPTPEDNSVSDPPPRNELNLKQQNELMMAKFFDAITKTYNDTLGLGTNLFDSIDLELESPKEVDQCYIKPTTPVSIQRAYDKRNACYFCHVLKAKIGRHYMTQHQNEKQVEKINKMTKVTDVCTSKELLRLAGNFKHNLKVLRRGTGQLLVARRPSIGKYIPKVTEYVPCLFCLGFFFRKQAATHIRHCKYGSKSKGYSVDKAIRILYFVTGNDEEVKTEIVNKMVSDSVRETINNDSTILQYGAMLLRKKGKTQRKFIANKMRELARLLNKINERKRKHENLVYYIRCKHHDTILQAALTMSQHADKGKEGPMTLAVRLGHTLIEICQLLKIEAINQEDEKLKQEYDDFLFLMKSRWSNEVSVPQMREYFNKKAKKIPQLPLTDDLVVLSKHIKEKIALLSENMKKAMSNPQEVNVVKELWQPLAKATLASIILFNKRREGEASKALLEDFTKRPNWKSLNSQEIIKSLSPSEKVLAEKFDMIQVRGKRNTTVPMILIPSIKEALELLVETRTMAEIKESNPFLFANTALRNIRGNDALKQCIDDCKNLVNPKNIQSTILRKYIGTVSQIMNLSENELEFLTRHMGHDLKIHKQFYRLHHSTIETTKVAKLLLAVDEGVLHKVSGQSLEELSIEKILPELQTKNNQEEKTDNAENGTLSSQDHNCTETSTSPNSNNSDHLHQEPKNTFILSNLSKKSKTSKVIQMESNSVTNSDTNDDINSDANFVIKPKKKISHKKWPKEIKEQALEYFKENIKTKRAPGKEACLEFIERNRLQERSWKDVKSLIYNNFSK